MFINPELEVPPSQRDRSLPMVVTLRGDEDIAEQFAYDAEQAMELLGIKRSRLTQISGRELRVGRIRRDRYMRPVYRESDLRDYQEWTRATATHQSSSKAIEQAIDSLDDRFNDLIVVLQEKWNQFQNHEAELIHSQIRQLQRSLREQFDSFERRRDEHAIWRDQLVRWQQRQRQLGTQLDSLQSGQDRASQQQVLFHQDLRELIAAWSLYRREQLDAQRHQEEKLQALKEQLGTQEIVIAGLQEGLSRMGAKQEELKRHLELTITKSFKEEISQLKELLQTQTRGEVREPSRADELRSRPRLRLRPRQRPLPARVTEGDRDRG
jgi:hypothetical protein